MESTMFTQIRHGIPAAFTCPISGKIMTKPVFCFEDKMTYDEESLKNKLSSEGKSFENQYTTNWFLKSRIDHFLEKNADIFNKKSGIIHDPASALSDIAFTVVSSSFIDEEEDNNDFFCP